MKWRRETHLKLERLQLEATTSLLDLVTIEVHNSAGSGRVINSAFRAKDISYTTSDTASKTLSFVRLHTWIAAASSVNIAHQLINEGSADHDEINYATAKGAATSSGTVSLPIVEATAHAWLARRIEPFPLSCRGSPPD